MIAEAVVAQRNYWSEILKAVHPHPTMSEAAEAVADAYDEVIHM